MTEYTNKTDFKWRFTWHAPNGSFISVGDDDMNKCLDDMEMFMRAIELRFNVGRESAVDRAIDLSQEPRNPAPRTNQYWPCQKHGTDFAKKSKKGTFYCDKCFQEKKAAGLI